MSLWQTLERRIGRGVWATSHSRDAPVRDDAKLDALAMHILDEGPKTLLGLVIKARAEKWLRRHLWTLAYDSLRLSTGVFALSSTVQCVSTATDPDRTSRSA
jgi:hypothetical protein